MRIGKTVHLGKAGVMCWIFLIILCYNRGTLMAKGDGD
ncbi:hypothetical protein B4099_1337 [Heyndrickxia coagulans]|uniref:Uncharacterized protein n=1 Tax=Heyndrickxia coagulans TaxID=1398 RepID=A0A150KFN4_HEYCO|nr:hypothetical protein B4099_1337 [Heyndrickxia coagulans]